MFKRFVFLICLFITLNLLLTSCAGCSRSGRRHLKIARAQQEARRERTVPEPETIDNNDLPEKREGRREILTPREEQAVKNELDIKNIPEARGKLIQVEGLVALDLVQLISDMPSNMQQENQIIRIQRSVFSNWNYVFDPAIDQDVWRSAEATIALKYNGRYTGDCDDFAILMASYARQLGLQSAVWGAFNSRGDGHAFAVFKANRNSSSLTELDFHTDGYGQKWYSLDWFTGSEHYQYNNLKVVITE